MSETGNLPAPIKAPLVAGGKPLAIVPQDFESVWRLAQVVHASKMAPRDLDSPEKISLAIMHGLEIGLKPMMALQKIAVVNNRPTIWGDAALALVRASGLLESISEEMVGEGDARIAVCKVKRKGEPEIVRTFSVADAKTAKLWSPEARITKQGREGPYTKDNDSPWHRFPDRMQQMRARGYALRDTFTDVLGGMYLREEIEESDDSAATPPKSARPVAPPPPEDDAPAVIEHKPAVEMQTAEPIEEATFVDLVDAAAGRSEPAITREVTIHDPGTDEPAKTDSDFPGDREPETAKAPPPPDDIAEVETSAPASAVEPPRGYDPARSLAKFEAAIKAAQDHDALLEAWLTIVEPHSESMTGAQYQNFQYLFDEAEKRFEP